MQRLEDEVKVWEPSSHAWWAVWGIVQGKEDLMAQVEKWRAACGRMVEKREVGGLKKGVEGIQLDGQQKEEEGEGRPTLRRGKSGELVDGEGQIVDAEVAEEEEAPVVDFDYFQYSLERFEMFRKDAAVLGAL